MAASPPSGLSSSCPDPARRAALATLVSGAAGALFAPAAGAAVRPLGLVLPTPNDALFRGDPSAFYMYVNRSFEGRTFYPWEGGKYGYVRNPKRSGGGLVYTKFHEGVDIRPASRDRNGEPLDTVGAIAAGRVVYANGVSSRSSYGKYVVVEHDWGYGPFYSLSAHLMTVGVQPGQRVGAGSPLGRLGYTGTGLDRKRAHLHLELNFLLNRRFGTWHGRHYRTPNHHGIHNGLNMAGIDIAGLYLAHRENPRITLVEFVGRMAPYFRVIVPKSRGFDLLDRYPWLLKANAASAPSLEITFSRSGVPLAVQPAARSVRYPAVTWVQPSSHSHAWNTRSRLTGSGSKAALSSSGGRYIQLVAGTF